MSVIKRLAAARPEELDPGREVDQVTRSTELSRAMMGSRATGGTDGVRAKGTRRQIAWPMWGLGLVGAAAAAALVVTTTVSGPADDAGTGRQAPPASGSPAVKLDARTVLLAAAERSAGQPEQAGAYWHSTRLSRNYYRIGSAADGYTIYTESRSDGWTPRATGQDQWSREQNLGARPASPADEAAWQRAGSPTKFTIELPTVKGPQGKGRLKKFVVTTDATRKPAHVSHSPLTDGDKVFWLGRNVTMKDLRGLPTDPARLKAWLLASYDGHGTESTSEKMSSDQWLFTVAGGLITDMPITPKVRAAAFRMLANLKTVESVGTVKDGQGRAGSAVAIVENTKAGGVQQRRLIIDDATGRALGSDIVAVKPAGTTAGMPAGSVWNSTTIVTDEWVASPPR
ncbi:CU044_5270 family protein [Actinomadura sp. HBU206391]|uniref:CU044_5270 family protein n=1 Tax=Actinomadura sp. HBU206391 TaxID=2731692 RepID=UPI00164F852D|nr:CU044_5270 family protein [Actinomadura sp. HBU206391]MBC6457584.1 CU044_5270 family protein [Actinomadura sp. HBU206391]